MTEFLAPAPQPSFRLIPSQYPPIGLFDTVTAPADLEAVMELAGWTNDRLVAERIDRLPRDELVYGRPNSSIVMAAFLHAPPSGARFNKGELGAWYASANLRTAAAEVGHHLRREAVSRSLTAMERTYRAYSARLEGEYVDIRALRETRPELYAPDTYIASQDYGEAVRAAGQDGILYGSVRLRDGINVVAYRPSKVLEVTQADHFAISVHAEHSRIEVKKLGIGE